MNTVRFAQIAVVILGVTVLAATGSRQAIGQELSDSSGAALTPSQIREDLVFLRDSWSLLDGSFNQEQRLEFESIVEDAMARADSLSPPEFALEVARAVAVSGNGHTNADLYGFLHLLNFLPIRVWWFFDGLYVVETHPDFVELLGARVAEIGGNSAEEALALVAPFISGTGEHVRFLSAGHLISLETLFYAGVSQSVDEVTLTLALPSGQTRTTTLRQQPPGDSPPPSGYGIPIPSPLDNPNRWPHVLDDVADRSPAFQAPAVDVAYEWMENRRVLYIRSNQIFSSDEVRLDYKLLELVDEVVVPERPRYVVVDLRLNTGGDLTNTILFSQILPGLVPSDGRIFVLVGNVTFSAALVTAAMLEGNGREKVSLVGERMGDNPQFWAEGREAPLPNSGIPVAPAGGFHDWNNGCGGLDDCYWAAEVFARSGVSLEPEIVVSTTFQDYAAGRDTVLETALALTE